MAKMTIYKPFDMSNFTLPYGDVYYASDSRYEISYNYGEFIQLRGDFYYYRDSVDDGYIDNIYYSIYNSGVFDISNMSINAYPVANNLRDSYTDGFLSYVLDGNDSISGSNGRDIIDGFAGHDYIESHGGVDTVLGGSGNDRMYLGSGDDFGKGGAGNDYIDGGAGRDISYYGVNRSQASVYREGNELKVYLPNLNETDTLYSIERVEFTNGTLAFDIDGNAGEVFRLYRAAFDRVPDTPGLSHNVELVDEGMALTTMSNAFLGSQEFQNIYGRNTTDREFLYALYNNVLERDPDQAGLEGWEYLLQSGQKSRADVLLGFSESAENQNYVNPTIEDGIWLV